MPEPLSITCAMRDERVHGGRERATYESSDLVLHGSMLVVKVDDKDEVWIKVWTRGRGDFIRREMEGAARSIGTAAERSGLGELRKVEYAANEGVLTVCDDAESCERGEGLGQRATWRCLSPASAHHFLIGCV